MTSSPMSGRSSPRTERAVVAELEDPSSIRLTTASAVRPFVPLAIPNWVSIVFGIPWPRSASPYAFASSIVPERSTHTTPENAVRSASGSRASSKGCIGPDSNGPA